jgi:hypothetical protein
MIRNFLKKLAGKTRTKSTYRDLLVEAQLTPAQTCPKSRVPGAKPIPFLLIFLLVNLLSLLILISALTRAHSSALIILATLTQALASIALIQTFRTEPGIIPKNVEKICPQIALLHNSEIISCQLSALEDPKSYNFPNFIQPIKFCKSCQIFRPPRTVHCKFCENCVLELDHHCRWLGCCIGKRNQKFFIHWLWTQAVHSCLGLYVNLPMGQAVGLWEEIFRGGIGLLCLVVTAKFVGL